jgi:hypothetical protein
MGAVRTSETSVYSNEITQRYIPKGSSLQSLFTLRIMQHPYMIQTHWLLKQVAHVITTGLERFNNASKFTCGV